MENESEKRKNYSIGVVMILVVMTGILSIWIGAWALLFPVVVGLWFLSGTAWVVIICVAVLLAMFIIGC